MGAPTAARHPWNTGFAWQDHHAPFRRLTTGQAEQFDRDGFIVLDGVFDDAELAPVVAAMDHMDAAAESFLATQDDGRMSIAEQGAITFGVEPSDSTRPPGASPPIRSSPISATT